MHSWPGFDGDNHTLLPLQLLSQTTSQYLVLIGQLCMTIPVLHALIGTTNTTYMVECAIALVAF